MPQASPTAAAPLLLSQLFPYPSSLSIIFVLSRKRGAKEQPAALRPPWSLEELTPPTGRPPLCWPCAPPCRSEQSRTPVALELCPPPTGRLSIGLRLLRLDMSALSSDPRRSSQICCPLFVLLSGGGGRSRGAPVRPGCVLEICPRGNNKSVIIIFLCS